MHTRKTPNEPRLTVGNEPPVPLPPGYRAVFRDDEGEVFFMAVPALVCVYADYTNVRETKPRKDTKPRKELLGWRAAVFNVIGELVIATMQNELALEFVRVIGPTTDEEQQARTEAAEDAARPKV